MRRERRGLRGRRQWLVEWGRAIAFSQTGHPTFGEFDETMILGRFGDIPREFERL
jgi:hypothetical protein